MPNSLYQLVYISRNEITGTGSAMQQEVVNILNSARANNGLLNITGALMFNARCFAQVLEGQRDDIQNTFERILCDLRHSNIVVLAFEPIAERLFANWSMAYISLNDADTAEFKDILQPTCFDEMLFKHRQIFQLLKEHLYAAE